MQSLLKMVSMNWCSPLRQAEMFCQPPQTFVFFCNFPGPLLEGGACHVPYSNTAKTKVLKSNDRTI